MYLASDHEMLHCHQPRPLIMERMWKSKVEIAPNCPRCTSSNTKFCYYNNYSLSQPRYFCKSCRRYWTKGGSLRNVPAGGGCRKSRRTKTVRLPSHGGSSSCADDGSPSKDLATSDPAGSSSGHDEPDIDMAAVFAKFLNRTEEANLSSDIPGSQGFNTQMEDLFGDCQTEFSTSDDGHEQLFAELGKGFPSDDHILQEGEAQEFPGRHDLNSFGMQSILSDEFVQDPIWSDSTTLTNFSWQPAVQLQELESFCNDQPKFSTNDCDNWSLYDLPSYDIFSRP